MPTLGNALDFAKYEAKQLRAHQLGTAPGTPVTGQLFYNTADNTLYWWDGTAWVSARGGVGTPADATTSSKGIVQLAGDLAGTATSPQIAAGAVTDAEVATANKNGAAGTHSMRTLGYSAGQAMPGNATLELIPYPAGDVYLNSKKITGLADPIADTDGANKKYVDGLAQGLDAKQSVRAATTVNVAIATALNSGDVLDGVTLANGDRVLVKDQSAPAENGIYVVAASPGRATDMDAWAEFPAAYTWVEQGTINADTGWITLVDQGGTLGTTAVPWTMFSGAGMIGGGAGLTKAGNTLDVGAGPGITVNADSVQVANDGVTNAMLADGAVNLASADVTGTLPIGKGGTGGTTQYTGRLGIGASGKYFNTGPSAPGTTWLIPQSTHQCAANRSNIVQVADNTSGAVELPDIVIASNGDITITWGASVTANSKTVGIAG